MGEAAGYFYLSPPAPFSRHLYGEYHRGEGELNLCEDAIQA